jgi:hypothetical protein
VSAAKKVAAGAPARIAVWAFDLGFLRYRDDVKIFRVQRHQLPYLHAQHGLFTWCPAADYRFLETGEWPSLEQTVARSIQGRPEFVSGPPLQKYTLPATEADQLLKLLWTERVSPAHLMPTLDHVALAMERVLGWIEA